MGQCPACNEWNTIVEEIVQKEEKRNWKQTTEPKKKNKALSVAEIEIHKEIRIDTQNSELNTVLGWWIGSWVRDFVREVNLVLENPPCSYKSL